MATTQSQKVLDSRYRSYEKDPINTTLRLLLNSSKCRAKKRGYEFDLTLEDLQSLAVDTCPLLGSLLHYGRPEGYANPHAPSLDRIDSSRGYTKDNVWIVSRRANRIKNDATPEELMKVALVLSKKLDL